MYKPSDVIVIIPVFNEEGSISKVIDEVTGAGFKVLCVNDASMDKSWEIICGKGVGVLNHSINLGQGATLESGFEVVRRNLLQCKLVATFDADGQHQVSDLLRFLDELNDNPKIDFILGSRFLDDRTQVSILKRIILKGFAFASKFSLGLKVTDRHNGLRLFKREFLLNFNLTISGYGHADEFLVYISKNDINYAEVGTHILYTDYSKFKGQPLINGVRTLFDGMVRGK
jgi:glycosyltransferase involved in cell wall biosynthesis